MLREIYPFVTYKFPALALADNFI